MAVAEIGSGWGSLAVHLARLTGALVTAINVSPAQISVARERAQAAGVSARVEFVELDYRKLSGRFDRVVSVGMMFAAADLATIHGIPQAWIRSTLGHITRAVGSGRVPSLATGGWYELQSDDQPYNVAPGFAAAWKKARGLP
jgi:SAM-dependent methyltransferase